MSDSEFKTSYLKNLRFREKKIKGKKENKEKEENSKLDIGADESY
jgi:hypothetical protein